MSEITIPPEAVEAAAKSLCRDNGWSTDRYAICIPVAAAAILAALRAWPGMTVKQSNEHVALFNSDPALILPFTTEKQDAEA